MKSKLFFILALVLSGCTSEVIKSEPQVKYYTSYVCPGSHFFYNIEEYSISSSVASIRTISLIDTTTGLSRVTSGVVVLTPGCMFLKQSRLFLTQDHVNEAKENFLKQGN